MAEEEAIIAFFPCVRFEVQIIMRFKGLASDQKNKSLEDKLKHSLKLHDELSNFYSIITKLVLICLKKGLPLVIENPYSTQHYLTRYWPIEPKIIDINRWKNGDYYEKPTQYWFINCEPLKNLIMDEGIAIHGKKKIEKERGAMRSMISPEYARRFIRQYLKKYDESDIYK